MIHATRLIGLLRSTNMSMLSILIASILVIIPTAPAHSVAAASTSTKATKTASRTNVVGTYSVVMQEKVTPKQLRSTRAFIKRRGGTVLATFAAARVINAKMSPTIAGHLLNKRTVKTVEPMSGIVGTGRGGESGGYPYAYAQNCAAVYGPFSWCIDTNRNRVFDTAEQFSQYGFAYRNCTDWVAYRLNSLGVKFTNRLSGGQFGNANNWDNNALRLGWTVSTTPRPHSIAVSEAGAYGHVAFVESVNSNGTVVISEYNRAGTGTYATRTTSFDKYIYVPGLTTAPQAPPAPNPTPKPTPAPTYWPEQQGSRGVNTFANPYNASGIGPKIAANQWVNVSCKVYAPQIASANPDGYWYKIASAPWNNAYYAPANTFWNGDIPGKTPYVHNTDFKVPNC